MCKTHTYFTEYECSIQSVPHMLFLCVNVRRRRTRTYIRRAQHMKTNKLEFTYTKFVKLIITCGLCYFLVYRWLCSRSVVAVRKWLASSFGNLLHSKHISIISNPHLHILLKVGTVQYENRLKQFLILCASAFLGVFIRCCDGVRTSTLRSSSRRTLCVSVRPKLI